MRHTYSDRSRRLHIRWSQCEESISRRTRAVRRLVPAARKPTPREAATLAHDIGLAALDLARQARAAGLTTICYLLERVALEAGAKAAAGQPPSDTAETQGDYNAATALTSIKNSSRTRRSTIKSVFGG
jgi:hypothetical protein